MKPLHVLVVEADPGRRAELSGLLSGAGHRAVPVGGGSEAADALGVPGLEAVLVDLTLPGLDMGALRRALAPDSDVPPDPLADAERRHITAALTHTRGNKRQAAILLGISRSTLLHKIRRYGLESVAVRGRQRPD
jgi:DNA-binding NtrC family response regulator